MVASHVGTGSCPQWHHIVSCACTQRQQPNLRLLAHNMAPVHAAHQGFASGAATSPGRCKIVLVDRGCNLK